MSGKGNLLGLFIFVGVQTYKQYKWKNAFVLGLLIFVVVQAIRTFRWNHVKLNFAGKTVFISGGSSGLGEEMCKQMIRLGAKKIIIAARRVDELERVKRESGAPEKVQVLQLDLSQPHDVLEKCTSLFANEKVDILVNNGGISQRDCFEDLGFDVCQKMMNVNCLSHIAVIKACLPGMMERKQGKIVNILSGSGIVALPMRTMYSSSKFALSGFGKALRAEVKPHGISVIQTYPDYIRTNISANAMTGDGTKFGKLDPNIAKGMACDEAASQTLKAIQLNISEFILGGFIMQMAPYLSVS